MNASGRIEAVRARLEEEEVGALMVGKVANAAYLTGFERVFDSEEAHAVVVTADSVRLYTDSRYVEAATAAAIGTAWEVVSPTENLYSSACDQLAAEGIESLAVEESMPYGRFRYISDRFRGNVLAIDQWVEELRQVKVAEEISRITAAQELTDRAYDHIRDYIRPGVVEREIALELEFFMRRNGSDGVAFPPIVASGPNSARPHATVTDRAIERGDFVKLDFGARVDGYCADMTRTFVVGSASEQQQRMYSAVLAANEAGIAAARAGVPGSAVDRAARDVIEAAGFGENFRHGLGHGVGLEIHELPSVSPRGDKSLAEHTVITIEPGVYLPGLGGVRIEDLVVVEAGGCRVLSASPKQLTEL